MWVADSRGDWAHIEQGPSCSCDCCDPYYIANASILVYMFILESKCLDFSFLAMTFIWPIRKKKTIIHDHLFLLKPLSDHIELRSLFGECSSCSILKHTYAHMQYTMPS